MVSKTASSDPATVTDLGGAGLSSGLRSRLCGGLSSRVLLCQLQGARGTYGATRQSSIITSKTVRQDPARGYVHVEQ